MSSADDFIKLYAPPAYITKEGELAKDDSTMLEWLETNFNKGKAFNRSNRAWKLLDLCMSYLYGDDNAKVPAGISKVQFKKVRRQLREMIANATNIRPQYEIPTFKKKYQDESDIYTKLNKHWWINEFIDRKVRAVGQWAGGAGTGFWFMWPEDDPNTGRTKITVKPLSPKNILLFHASGDNIDLDTLYGVDIRVEMSIPEAHEKFPWAISIIQKDRNVPSTMARISDTVYKAYRGLHDRLKNKGNKQELETPYPTCDIHYTFIRDNSINTTGHDIVMGGKTPEQIFSSKSAYVVPSYFDKDGNRTQYSRKQCMLFPFRRLVISSSLGIIDDGAPPYINRHVPLVDFRFEEIVGEFLGIPPANDSIILEESANELARASVDAVTGRVQPPMVIDSSIPKPLALKFAANPRTLQGKIFRYATQKLVGAIKPLIDAAYYVVDPNSLGLINLFHQMSDYEMGTHDLTAITQLAQMPGADTQDAMIRAMGTLALDQSRSFEYSLARAGQIWLDFAPQVYTTEQRLMFLGEDGVTIEQWDFDPDLLIPKTELNTSEPMWLRLRNHLDKFSLYIKPQSLQERKSQTNKLTALQMKKLGMTFASDRFIYETFYDDNKYDELVAEFWAEQENRVKIAAKLQALSQGVSKEMGSANYAAELLAKLIQGAQEGRPNENTAPPKLEQKMDETGVPRTTIATNPS